jgi:hypothetical protein
MINWANRGYLLIACIALLVIGFSVIVMGLMIP